MKEMNQEVLGKYDTMTVGGQYIENFTLYLVAVSLHVLMPGIRTPTHARPSESTGLCSRGE